MNYTTNYHLPQWAETDRIMMEDFNQMCSDIDQGIKTAQVTANTAQGTANTAQGVASAAYCPTNKPYVVGTYTGSIYGSTTVNLGFRPSFLIISSMEATGLTGWTPLLGYTVITAGGNVTDCVTLTDTGFTTTSLEDVNDYPKLNDSRRTYAYIAFR